MHAAVTVADALALNGAPLGNFILLPQILDGRTIHVREDQQEGMNGPPGMGPGGMPMPPGMGMGMGMGGPPGMGMGMGGPGMGGGGPRGGERGGDRGERRERRVNADPETRKTCQIVVHGLPFSYESAQLRDMVKVVGPILECEVKKDRITGRSKGWATVLYQTPEAANAAIQVRSLLKPSDRMCSCCRSTPSHCGHVKAGRPAATFTFKVLADKRTYGSLLTRLRYFAFSPLQKFNGYELHGRVLSVKMDAHIP